MFESPEKLQIVESLKSYPPDLLLRAALSHNLPPELKAAIQDFLNKSSRTKTSKSLEKGEIVGRKESEIVENSKWFELIQAYNKFYSSPDYSNEQESARDEIGKFTQTTIYNRGIKRRGTCQNARTNFT